MSAVRVDMHRLQELVRLHRKGMGCREVARLLKMGPNTEREYRRALDAKGLLHGPDDALPALDVLRAAVEEALPSKTPPQETSTVEAFADAIEEKWRNGSGPKAIWAALREELPGFTGSRWAVARLCRRLHRAQSVRPDDIAIPVITPPGAEAQVDFGYVGELYDPDRGVLRKAWVFAMVLGYSRHMYARIVFDQRVETWLWLHAQAFEHFGGVVASNRPDNLKAAVIRGAFNNGDARRLNRSYRELARHYGFVIDPTPVYSPEKKGKVEAAVKYIKRSFIAPRAFDDIDDANARLVEWVMETAGTRIHGTTGRPPLEMFAEEQSHLRPLPTQRWNPVVWHPCTVHRDCHVMFDRRRYPVPWRFVGQKVWARADAQTVTLYTEDDVRIADYARGREVDPALVDACLPPQRAALRHRSRRYWLDRADAMGDMVGDHIRAVFDSDDVLNMLRPVQAMVTLLEKHPPKRARAACRRASFYGNHTYAGLRDILRRGLDLQPLPTAVVPASATLEAPRYARTAAELLGAPLEETHEPC